MKLEKTLLASVAGAALFALSAPVAVPAAKADISNGNKNSLTVSGQIVRSIMWADDGNNDDVFQMDGNGWTNSRLRWVAKSQLNEATSVGGIIEMNVPLSNSPGNTSLSSLTRQGDSTAWGIRKADISVAHKQFGTVSIGQGDPFTNGMAENGLGMGVLNGGVAFRSAAGGFVFFDNNAGAYSTVGVGSVFSNLDFRSRDDRVGYQTPSFGGFKFGADWIDGSGGDVGVKYAGKFGGVAVKGGVGYVALGGLSTTIDSRYGGSVGLEHDSGIGAAASYVQDDANENASGDDPSQWGLGLSYAAGLYSGGATKFAVSYAQYDEQAANGTAGDGTSWTVGVLQKFDAVGVDAGLQYTHFSYDDNTTADYEDVSTVLFSTRILF